MCCRWPWRIEKNFTVGLRTPQYLAEDIELAADLGDDGDGAATAGGGDGGI